MRYGKLSCIVFYYCYLKQFLSINLMDTQLWPEQSYEQGLSVLLFGSFLGISSLLFSGTEHGVRRPRGVVHDRVRFFENNIFAPKMRRIGQG